MKNTEISWTDHTFNPWIGCSKVSPGCAHCYAAVLMDTRYGRVRWGAGQPRQRTSAVNWREPLRWNRKAALEGFRPRVFCASLADWLDHEVPVQWRADLLELISQAWNLDWLLLSKRIGDWRARMEEIADVSIIAQDWLSGDAPANVWLGTSTEDQARWDERIPALAEIPARVRFASAEPLLGPIDAHGVQGIDWVIVGGESGPGARQMDPAWARSLRDCCARSGVQFHMKQMGGVRRPMPEIPEDLMIRGWPEDKAYLPIAI